MIQRGAELKFYIRNESIIRSSAGQTMLRFLTAQKALQELFDQDTVTIGLKVYQQWRLAMLWGNKRPRWKHKKNWRSKK